MNNSSTGGPIQPLPRVPELETAPPGLTFEQFIQTVLVGISGFEGTLVRPNWQPEPPKEPDIMVNWLAYGVQNVVPDANAFIGFTSEDEPYLQRNELLQIQMSIYGPAAYENTGVVRDGFQIQQNLASLKKANMGFAYDEQAIHSPDLVNGRWFNRYILNVFLRRQIIRSYPILTFLSASGTIYTQTAENPNYQKNFKAGS
jgi:hypothetical protein